MSKSINSKARKQLYAGDLLEPIHMPAHAGDAGTEIDRSVEAVYRKTDKLLRLLDFYGIDDGAKHKWLRLSLALAEAHVPGFRVVCGTRRKRGRVRTWKAGLADDLVGDVAFLTNECKMDIKDAIRRLREDPTKDWGKFTQQNLETREREHRRERKKYESLARELKNSGLIAGVATREISQSKSGLIAGVGRISRTDEK